MTYILIGLGIIFLLKLIFIDFPAWLYERLVESGKVSKISDEELDSIHNFSELKRVAKKHIKY